MAVIDSLTQIPGSADDRQFAHLAARVEAARRRTSRDGLVERCPVDARHERSVACLLPQAAAADRPGHP